MQLPSLGGARGRRAAVAGAAALALAGGAATFVAQPAGAALPKSFAGPSYPATLTAGPSGDKQQSKVWRNSNAWWAVMVSATKGVPTIQELKADHTWRDTGVVVDTRADSTADVWYAANTLYVVSRTATGNILYTRFAFNTTTRVWSKVTGFPVTVATGGTESASLARDSGGVMWATWTQGSRVWFAKSTGTNDKVWAKALLPVADNTVAPDDVSAILAFNGKIGIGYSDQQSNAFHFAVHTDGVTAATWKFETPLSGVALADDHISLKAVGGDARVFAAVKTSQDAAGAPDTTTLIYVLRRNADTTWTLTRGSSVGDKATRAQIFLDRENSRVYLLTSGPATGGTIYYKSAPFVGMKWARGRGAPLITATGSVLNDVSVAKGSTTGASDMVAIASDTANKRYYHAEIPVQAADEQAPISQTQINSSSTAAGSITTTWPLATDDRGITAYDVYQGNTKISTITITAANENLRTFTFTKTGLAPGTYRFAVVAKDAAGNSGTKRTASAVTLP
jgi:hypothetical protein